MTLRVRARGDPAETEAKSLFDRWRTRIPTAIDGARAERGDEGLVITVPLPDAEGARQVWFFPHAGGVVMHAADQQHRVSGSDTVDVLVKPGTGVTDRLDGVVAVTTHAGVHGFAIDMPIERRTDSRG